VSATGRLRAGPLSVAERKLSEPILERLSISCTILMLNVAGYPLDCDDDAGLPDGQLPAKPLSARLSELEIEAWESLYLQNRRLIRSLLAAQLGYTAELDDVTQQVFETAFGLVQSGKVRLKGEQSGMRAWLVAIAQRLAHAEVRRRSKLHQQDAPAPGDLGTTIMDPVGWQLLQRTRTLVAKLPPRLRVPWLLRHLEDMSLEEIAMSCGASLATIKRRLLRADRRFSKLAASDSVLREHLNDGGAP